MSVAIRIKTDNAAFDGCRGYELARILRELAERLCFIAETGAVNFSMRDANGNTVGTCKVSK